MNNGITAGGLTEEATNRSSAFEHSNVSRSTSAETSDLWGGKKIKQVSTSSSYWSRFRSSLSSIYKGISNFASWAYSQLPTFRKTENITTRTSSIRTGDPNTISKFLYEQGGGSLSPRSSISSNSNDGDSNS